MILKTEHKMIDRQIRKHKKLKIKNIESSSNKKSNNHKREHKPS